MRGRLLILGLVLRGCSRLERWCRFERCFGVGLMRMESLIGIPGRICRSLL